MTQVLTPTLTPHPKPGIQLGVNMVLPALAWVFACIVAAFVLVLSVAGLAVYEDGWSAWDGLSGVLALIPASLFVAIFVAVMTILPWPLFVVTLKLLRLHRGFGDMASGALMGAGLIEMMSNPLAKGAPAVTLAFALAGAVGGLTYWIMAGRPD